MLTKWVMSVTDSQMDLLIDIFKKGVDRASLSLQELTRECGSVHIAAAQPEILSIQRLARQQAAQVGDTLNGALVDFSGPFTGRALLLCSARESATLVKLVFKEMGLGEVPEETMEALCELGNVLLNACIASFSRIFGREILVNAPKPVSGGYLEVLRGGSEVEETKKVLYLPVLYAHWEQSVRIEFVFDMISIQSLVICLESYLEKAKYRGSPFPD